MANAPVLRESEAKRKTVVLAFVPGCDASFWSNALRT
jgi:hypothetical protein